LVKKLRGVREPAARMAILTELSASIEPGIFVHELDALGRFALQRDHDALEMAMSLLQPARVFADPARVSLLEQTAGEAGCIVALQWLWAAAEAFDTPGATGQTKQLVDRAFASLTLGDRRALARKATYDQLTRLVGDPDPFVVTHVLANPRCTEAIVMAMCSKRPTVSAALQVVIDTPPWVARLPIRIALAHNPYLAIYAAVPLLVTLPRGEIADIRDDEKLAGSLRLAASRLLSV
jgi:hypothetical protein